MSEQNEKNMECSVLNYSEKDIRKAFNCLRGTIEDGLPEKIARLKWNPSAEIWVGRTYPLVLEYEEKAYYEFILFKDVDSFRRNLKASIYYEIQQDKCLKVTLSQSFDSSYYVAQTPDILLNCFITGDFATCKYILQLTKPFIDFDKSNMYINEIFYNFISTVLVQPEMQDELFADIDKFLKDNHECEELLTLKLHMQMITAIMNRDSSLLQESLYAALEHKAIYLDPDLEYEEAGELFWRRGIGIANMGIAFGLKLDIDHPLLPKALLLTPEMVKAGWENTDIIQEPEDLCTGVLESVRAKYPQAIYWQIERYQDKIDFYKKSLDEFCQKYPGALEQDTNSALEWRKKGLQKYEQRLEDVLKLLK